MMRNIPQYTVAIAAVLRAGCAVANVNLLYTARKLEHQRVDSGAEAIVVLENFAGTLEVVIDRTAVSKVVLASTLSVGVLKRALGYTRGASSAQDCGGVSDAPRRGPYRDGLSRGMHGRRQHEPQASGADTERRDFSSVHRRKHRFVQRSDAIASRRARQHPANGGVIRACAENARCPADDCRLRTADTSHFCANDLLLDGRSHKCQERDGPRSARQPWLGEDAFEAPCEHASCIQHVVQRVAE